jgi:hypothetical protein
VELLEALLQGGEAASATHVAWDDSSITPVASHLVSQYVACDDGDITPGVTHIYITHTYHTYVSHIYMAPYKPTLDGAQGHLS